MPKGYIRENDGLQNCKIILNRMNHFREIAIRTRPKMNTFIPFDADFK